MTQGEANGSKPEIPDWKCERYLLNELDDGEMERIRRAAETDEALRARLGALRKSNREILEKYPAGWMGRRIEEKLGDGRTAPAARPRVRRGRFPRLILVPAGLLAVAAFSIFVLPGLLPTGDQVPGAGITRIKGPGSQLRLYKKVVTGSRLLKSGDTAAPHDLILLQYQTEARGYGAIVSVDGRGKITTHLPARGTQAASIEPGRSHLLEYSYELDDAPLWEIFFFVTSAAPFRIASVVEALENSPFVTNPPGVDATAGNSLTAPDLPEDFHINHFVLIKDTPHEN